MIWACAGEWSNNQDYNYGWFVPPLALYFWWKRHERPQAAVTSDEWRVASGRPGGEETKRPKDQGTGRWFAWLIVLASLLFIWPLEVVRQTPIHWRPILWTIGLIAFGNSLAVGWLAGGRAALRRVAFPAAFMLLAIPWPTFLESAISFPLMQLVTQWSVGILHLLGYPATAAGTTITLPNSAVGVEEACSGLRSLQTALMVGAAAGELARLKTGARLALLLVAFVMALGGNQVRVLMLVMAGMAGGNRAVASMHDAAGYVVLAILLSGVGLAAWAMAKLGGVAKDDRRSQIGDLRDEEEVGSGQWAVGRDRNEEVEGGRFEIGDLRKGGTGGWVVLGMACAAMVLAHGWFWWRGSMAPAPKAAMLAPAESGDFQSDENVPAEILGILGPDEYRYIRQLRDGVPGKVAGYHFYWRPRKGNANQLYHRPDRCMPGAGWRIEGEVEQQNVRLGDREFVFNVFPFRGPGGPALMLWGSFLNGEPVEIEFNSDVYLNTANLAQFVRTGTRTYSYEVAALIMPYEGSRPTAAQIEAFANKIFTSTER
jgi:exosortase